MDKVDKDLVPLRGAIEVREFVTVVVRANVLTFAYGQIVEVDPTDEQVAALIADGTFEVVEA